MLPRKGESIQNSDVLHVKYIFRCGMTNATNGAWSLLTDIFFQALNSEIWPKLKNKIKTGTASLAGTAKRFRKIFRWFLYNFLNWILYKFTHSSFYWIKTKFDSYDALPSLR